MIAGPDPRASDLLSGGPGSPGSPGGPGGRCLVIHNPTAGGRRRRKLEAALDELRAHGITVVLSDTGGPGDSETMARDVEDGLVSASEARQTYGMNVEKQP